MFGQIILKEDRYTCLHYFFDNTIRVILELDSFLKLFSFNSTIDKTIQFIRKIDNVKVGQFLSKYAIKFTMDM